MKTYIPVSIIMPMRNSETTLKLALESIEKQEYPVKEIIIIDNKSIDNSVAFVERYKKKSKIEIKLFKRTEDKGVGASYNYGVAHAYSELVVFMHSDSALPSSNELRKLTEPFRKNKKVIATSPSVALPESVWNTYNFWQKFLFARAVNVEIPSFNGKFDCIKKEVFLKVGGFDVEKFNGIKSIGGEDADLHMRLKNIGKIEFSGARVVHYHYLGSGYSFLNLLKTKRHNARSYGRLLRVHWREFSFFTLSILVLRPVLSIIPFLPFLHLVGILLLFIYALVYAKIMYLRKVTLLNPLILLLPWITIILLYLETIWMFESFFFIQEEV